MDVRCLATWVLTAQQDVKYAKHPIGGGGGGMVGGGIPVHHKVSGASHKVSGAKYNVGIKTDMADLFTF